MEQPIMQLTKIDLDRVDTELFVLFRKHQDDFQILADSGFFALEEGQVFIYKQHGKIKEIDFKLVAYRRKKVR